MPIFNNLQVDESRFQPSLESFGIYKVPSNAYTISSSDGENPALIDEAEIYYCVVRSEMDLGIAFLGNPKVYNNGSFVGQVTIDWIESPNQIGSGTDFILYLNPSTNAKVTIDGTDLSSVQDLNCAVWNSEFLPSSVQ